MEKKDVISKLIKSIQEGVDDETLAFALPGYAGRQLVSYQAIRNDLIQCLNSVKELMGNNHNEVVRTALWYSSISLYGKCFTDASTSKSSKLESKDCFTKGDKFIGVHEQIMHLRHNLVAHRGDTIQEVGIAYLKVRLSDMAIGGHVRQGRFKIPENLNVFADLLQYLIEICEQKFEKATSKAWDHMTSTYTPEEIALLKIAGPTVKNPINSNIQENEN